MLEAGEPVPHISLGSSKGGVGKAQHPQIHLLLRSAEVWVMVKWEDSWHLAMFWFL